MIREKWKDAKFLKKEDKDKKNHNVAKNYRKFWSLDWGDCNCIST